MYFKPKLKRVKRPDWTVSQFRSPSKFWLDKNENSDEIYSTGGILIGKWNEECDDIIWENDEYKEKHLKFQKSN